MTTVTSLSGLNRSVAALSVSTISCASGFAIDPKNGPSFT